MEGAPADAPPPPAKNSLDQVTEDFRARVRAVLADRKQRPFFIGAVLLGVALVIGFVWWLWRAPDVAVVEIQTTNVELALSVVARVRPDNLVEVRSQNGGEIVRLLRDDGDVVALGEPLAVVRSAVEQAQADASSARVAAAQAESRRARLAFNRTRTLADRGFASAAALEEARATLQAAEAGLAAASADRRAAAARTGEFTIRSPMAGVILVRVVDPGQVISPDTALFQIGSRDGVELQADVDEAYADALRPGMAARAALSGSDLIFPARITEVSPRVDPTTGGRLVKLVPDEAMSIPPGRSVDVTIIVERREAGIVVPRQAVIDATTDPRVYVVDQGGMVRDRDIVIADWPSTNAIIDDGLVAGDRVVLTPAEVQPSLRVRARPDSQASTAGS